MNALEEFQRLLRNCPTSVVIQLVGIVRNCANYRMESLNTLIYHLAPNLEKIKELKLTDTILELVSQDPSDAELKKVLVSCVYIFSADGKTIHHQLSYMCTASVKASVKKYNLIFKLAKWLRDADTILTRGITGVLKRVSTEGKIFPAKCNVIVSNAKAVYNAGLIPPIVALMKNNDDETKMHSAGVLANCARIGKSSKIYRIK